MGPAVALTGILSNSFLRRCSSNSLLTHWHLYEPGLALTTLLLTLLWLTWTTHLLLLRLIGHMAQAKKALLRHGERRLSKTVDQMATGTNPKNTHQ